MLFQDPGSESEPLIRHDEYRGKGRGRGSPPQDQERVRVIPGRVAQSESRGRGVICGGDEIVTSRPIRTSRSREESNQFSWDPNSKMSGSRASSRSKGDATRQRDGSRNNSRNGSVSQSPKTSPQFVSHSRPSSGPGQHSRLSPGSSAGSQGGGQYHGGSQIGGQHHGGSQGRGQKNGGSQQDPRGGSRMGSSVGRSASLEFEQNGKLEFFKF